MWKEFVEFVESIEFIGLVEFMEFVELLSRSQLSREMVEWLNGGLCPSTPHSVSEGNKNRIDTRNSST